MNGPLRPGLLLGVSLLFVVMGLVIVALGDWRLGLGNTIFFGLAAAVFAYQLRELSRFEGPAQVLTLRGGVPLLMSGQRRGVERASHRAAAADQSGGVVAPRARSAA